GAVHPGREEHGVPEAHEPRVAEEHVVADRVGRQHHDATQHAVVERRQEQLQPRKPSQDGQVERQRPASLPCPHAAASPKSPRPRTARTRATSSVATILASVGEKKTEITPSERPTSKAATSVPRRLPR